MFLRLEEAERSQVRRDWRKTHSNISPTRLHATVRAVKSLQREGLDEDILSDPEKLYVALKDSFVLFGMLSDYERRKTVDAVMRKMDLYREDKTETGTKLIERHLSCGNQTARDFYNALITGTLSETATRFMDIESSAIGAAFTALIESGILPRNRLREIGKCPVVAKSIIKGRILDG